MLHRLRAVVRAAAVAVALGVATLPAPVATAAPRAPEGFFGVVADRTAVDGTVPLGAQMRRMARVGAETVGMSFPWLTTQPRRDGPMDWSRIDRRVAAAARAGLRVHPVLIAAPPWARRFRELEFSPPADPEAFAAFAGAAVERYGPRGRFWAEHPRLPRRAIRDWQVWNEPVGGDGDDTPSVFWPDDAHFLVRYVPTLRAAGTAIHAAHPGARVVLGALVGQSWGTLELIYEAGAGDAFDVVALHPYTADAANVIRIVELVRRVMRRHGDAAKPIQLTEVGWPAFDARSVKRLGQRRAALAQAGWLRSAFRGFLQRRRALGIDLVLWYTWIGRDRSARDAFDHSGLLRLERSGRLRAKPALRAFARVARSAQAARDRG